jgi:hypothetical protein
LIGAPTIHVRIGPAIGSGSRDLRLTRGEGEGYADTQGPPQRGEEESSQDAQGKPRPEASTQSTAQTRRSVAPPDSRAECVRLARGVVAHQIVSSGVRCSPPGQPHPAPRGASALASEHRHGALPPMEPVPHGEALLASSARGGRYWLLALALARSGQPQPASDEGVWLLCLPRHHIPPYSPSHAPLLYSPRKELFAAWGTSILASRGRVRLMRCHPRA